MNKKKIIVTIVILVLILLIGAGAFCFFHKPEEKKIATPSKKTEDTLEQYKDGSEDLIDYDVVDNTGSYSEEELAAMKEEALTVINQYFGTMYNFKSDTKDFSAALKGFYGTSDIFKDNNSDLAGNVYQEFQGVHLESSYENFHMYTLHVRADTLKPEISVMGTARVNFKTDDLKQGEYDVLCNLVMAKETDTWQMYTVNANNVFAADTVKAFYPNENAGQSVKFTGDIVMAWDFSDVDGFLSDYTYGMEWKDSEDTVLEKE